MGTYRNYKLSVYKKDKKVSMQEIFNTICNLMDKNNFGFCGIKENIQDILEMDKGKVSESDFKLISYYPKKWIDRDKEMIVLSKMFPNVIFKTFASNDYDVKDAWNVYYKNGVSYCPKKYGKPFKEETINIKIKKYLKVSDANV